MNNIPLVAPQDIHLLHDHYISQLRAIVEYLRNWGWSSMGLRFAPKSYNQQLLGNWTFQALHVKGQKSGALPVFTCFMNKKKRDYNAEDYQVTFSFESPTDPERNTTQSFILSKTQDCGISFFQFIKSIQDIWPSG